MDICYNKLFKHKKKYTNLLFLDENATLGNLSDGIICRIKLYYINRNGSNSSPNIGNILHNFLENVKGTSTFYIHILKDSKET